MVIKKGKDLEDLKDYLKRVENYENEFHLKSIFSENQTINLKADVRINKDGVPNFHSWSISSNIEGKKSLRVKKKYSSIIKALEDVRFDPLSQSFATLSLYSIAQFKTEKGKFVTKWVQFDAGSPFWFDKNGNIQVFSESIVLNKEELEYCKANPIGLYDGDNIYLLSENALVDIARISDAKGRKDTSSPIGAYSLRHYDFQAENFQRSILPAMVIGDILYEKKYNINIVYKEMGDSQIRMCHAITGKYYRQISSTKLFDRILSDIATIAPYEFKEGYIDKLGSTVKFVIKVPLLNKDLEIELEDSVLPGYSASFSAYYRFDRSKIYITGAALKHNESLSQLLENKERILSKTFFDDINLFLAKISSNKIVSITKGSLNPIVKVIGNKNSDKLITLIGEKLPIDIAIKEISELSYYPKYDSLPEKLRETFDCLI